MRDDDEGMDEARTSERARSDEDEQEEREQRKFERDLEQIRKSILFCPNCRRTIYEFWFPYQKTRWKSGVHQSVVNSGLCYTCLPSFTESSDEYNEAKNMASLKGNVVSFVSAAVAGAVLGAVGAGVGSVATLIIRMPLLLFKVDVDHHALQVGGEWVCGLVAGGVGVLLGFIYGRSVRDSRLDRVNDNYENDSYKKKFHSNFPQSQKAHLELVQLAQKHLGK